MKLYYSKLLTVCARLLLYEGGGAEKGQRGGTEEERGGGTGRKDVNLSLKMYETELFLNECCCPLVSSFCLSSP